MTGQGAASPPWRCVAAVLLAAIAGGIVRADVVTTKRRRPWVSVKIVTLAEGQLRYRLSTGRESTRGIGEIEYLQVSEWPLFNLAEKQQRSGHLRQAAGNYERLLAKLTEAAPDADRRPGAGPKTAPRQPGAEQLDRELLVQCRLLRVYDRQGRFDRAVNVYLDVIERMPAVLETLRPARLPAPGSTFLHSALAQLDAAIERHGPDAIGVSLAMWRDSWPGQRGEGSQTSFRGSGPAGTNGRRPVESAAPRQAKEPLREIQARVEAGGFDEALEHIESLQKPSAGACRADLYYWQARALLGKRAADESEAGKRDRRRAGLALMRVVIHFPAHSLAPECLFRAGGICQRSGQREQAVNLWSELVETYPTAAPWAEWARQALSRIQR